MFDIVIGDFGKTPGCDNFELFLILSPKNLQIMTFIDLFQLHLTRYHINVKWQTVKLTWFNVVINFSKDHKHLQGILIQ